MADDGLTGKVTEYPKWELMKQAAAQNPSRIRNHDNSIEIMDESCTTSIETVKAHEMPLNREEQSALGLVEKVKDTTMMQFQEVDLRDVYFSNTLFDRRKEPGIIKRLVSKKAKEYYALSTERNILTSVGSRIYAQFLRKLYSTKRSLGFMQDIDHEKLWHEELDSFQHDGFTSASWISYMRTMYIPPEELIRRTEQNINAIEEFKKRYA